MARVKIIRAFSETKQARAYEPINAFCSIEIETDGTEEISVGLYATSKAADEFCRAEVAKTITDEMAKRNPMPQGKSPKEKKDITLEEAQLELGSNE
jgi:hypothetical protein